MRCDAASTRVPILFMGYLPSKWLRMISEPDGPGNPSVDCERGMADLLPGCSPRRLASPPAISSTAQRRFIAADDVERMRRRLFDDLLDAAVLESMNTMSSGM